MAQTVNQNGSQVTWIFYVNNGAVADTNVEVALTPDTGIKVVNVTADKGVYNYTTNILNVGSLDKNAKIRVVAVFQVTDITAAPYTLTAVISGDNLDDNVANNTLTLSVTSTDHNAQAGANDATSAIHGNVSDNDVACTGGVTEWRHEPTSLVNIKTLYFDTDTGEYAAMLEDPFIDGSFQYSIWCDTGSGFTETSGPAVQTVKAILDYDGFEASVIALGLEEALGTH